MNSPPRVIELTTSPHLHTDRSVQMIMGNVVFALLPICAYAIWLFGISAFVLLVTTTAACVFTEHFACRISRRESSVGDLSVVITGLLLGLILPPGFPLWMAAVGGFIAVAPGKLLFGGLGFNVFNPALVARAFLQAAFPVAITAYTPVLALHRFAEWIPSTLAVPLMKAQPLANWIHSVQVDAFSGATPLMLQKFDHVSTSPWVLLLGQRAGSAGETSALLIFLCGAYLIIRKLMDWRIPAAMLGSAAITGGVFYLIDPVRYPSPLFVVLSGGLMLGAMFMATDPVASPVTPAGVWIYGALMGLITVLIRLKGGLAEGVMYAILLGNALSPLIDNLTQPRTYGARGKDAGAPKREART
jgi:electron transport complex protein RnfD